MVVLVQPGWQGLAAAAAIGRVLSVLGPLQPADHAVATTVGDVAELLDVHVQQVARPLVLVAADRFTGGPVDLAEPADPAALQHRMHRGGRHAQN
jgi:hypothetical protein